MVHTILLERSQEQPSCVFKSAVHTAFPSTVPNFVVPGIIIRFAKIFFKWFSFHSLTGYVSIRGVVPLEDYGIRAERLKVKPQTGEVLHPMGKGRVGLDIGTQTLAYSAERSVGLVELAQGVQDIQNELRRINRAMDRSRRATNPQFFAEDGEIIRKGKLPPTCLTAGGKRQWVEGKRYKVLAARRRYLYRVQAALRVQKHHELANKVLATGDTFFIETMNFRALAKKAKPQKKETLAPGEKLKR